jgi:hypothetical protein
VDNPSLIHTEPYRWQSCAQSGLVNLPPLGVTMLKWRGNS